MVEEGTKHGIAGQIAEDVLDAIGETMIDAVDGTGRTLQNAAAKAVDATGEALEEVSELIDDITESGPLKEWGDRIGETGREKAEALDEKADELEHDYNPSQI